jgi:hypothetical protein
MRHSRRVMRFSKKVVPRFVPAIRNVAPGQRGQGEDDGPHWRWRRLAPCFSEPAVTPSSVPCQQKCDKSAIDIMTEHEAAFVISPTPPRGPVWCTATRQGMMVVAPGVDRWKVPSCCPWHGTLVNSSLFARHPCCHPCHPGHLRICPACHASTWSTR